MEQVHLQPRGAGYRRGSDPVFEDYTSRLVGRVAGARERAGTLGPGEAARVLLRRRETLSLPSVEPGSRWFSDGAALCSISAHRDVSSLPSFSRISSGTSLIYGLFL